MDRAPERPAGEVPWEHVVLRMLLASVPVAGGALEVGYSAWVKRRRARLDDVARGLHSGADEVDLLRAVEDNPDVLDLWLRAAEAGQRARIERARVALGMAVAKAATDPAEWDEAELLVDALADLREPHVQLLVRIVELEAGARAAVGTNAPKAMVRKEMRQEAHHLVAEYPMPIQQTLLRHGLVVAQAMSYTGVATANEATDLGRRLLGELEAAARQDPT